MRRLIYMHSKTGRNFLSAFFKSLVMLLCIVYGVNLNQKNTVYATVNSNHQLTVYIGKSTSIQDYLLTFIDDGWVTDNEKWSYSSSNNKIAKVDKKGNITGVSKGKATITINIVREVYSAKHKSWINQKDTMKINVTCIPYDNSTDYRYFDYEIKNGKIEITGRRRVIKNLVIPKEILGYPVVAISDYAFAHNSELKTITLLGNVETIGEGAFEYCDTLETVILNDEVITIKDSAFEGCKSLKSVKFSKKLESIGQGAFVDCLKLKEVELGKSIKQIGGGAFENCTSLEKVIINGNVETISPYTFFYCINLKSAYLGNNLKKIGESAFEDCRSLEIINFNGNIDTLETNAFSCCYKLKSIQLGNNLKRIGRAAFENCISLESVNGYGDIKINLPDNIEVIESSAFSGCESIKEIAFPSSVKELGEYVFWGCSNLKKITIPDSIVKIGVSCFSECGELTEIIVNNNIKREVANNIFYGSIYYNIESAYIRNITFHFSDEDWKNINLLLKAYKQMDIKEDDSYTEKIRKVHDWMVINMSYSYKQFFYYYLDEDLNYYEIAFEKGFGICDLYSFIFQRFMYLLDIECKIVSSSAMDHAWNMVKLDDGCWYHVDVTWDDPGWNDEVWEKGWLSYANLLRDDEGIKSTGHHDWNEDAPKANGRKYLNYFDHSYSIKF